MAINDVDITMKTFGRGAPLAQVSQALLSLRYYIYEQLSWLSILKDFALIRVRGVPRLERTSYLNEPIYRSTDILLDT